VAQNDAVIAALAAATMLAAAPVHIAVTAPGHTPKVGVHWNYTLHVTRGGKPVKALLTEQVVDPIGGTHPVQFGTSTKIIKNWRITGVFRDFMIWPRSSRGVPLTWRIIVVVGKTKSVVNYKVTPHA
jgi:hypothetical protein